MSNFQSNQILKRIQEKWENDGDYGEKLEKLLPQMVKALPEDYAQRYLDIIQTSVESDFSNLHTYLLAELI